MSTTAIDPSGLGIDGEPANWIDVWNTRNPKPTHTTRTANQAIHRHRREGRCPSGNSRKRNVASPAGNTSQFSGSWTQPTQAVSGSGAMFELLNTY